MKSLTAAENKRQGTSPLQLEAPKFNYEQDTWANSRTLNVERIAEHWGESPTLVRVFSDKKLGPHSMVLLRKDTLESLTNLIDDLKQSEAFVKHNLEAAFTSIKLIQHLVEKESSEDQTALKLAVKQMTHIWGQFSSTIEYHAPERKVRSSTITEEERKLAASLDAGDNE